MVQYLFADLVCLEAMGSHEIQALLKLACHLPNKSNTPANTLVVFQDLRRSDLEHWKDTSEECFKFLLRLVSWPKEKRQSGYRFCHSLGKIRDIEVIVLKVCTVLESLVVGQLGCLSA